MIPEKAPRKREAVGLSPNLEAYLATTQDIQRIMAAGVRADGSLTPETIRALCKAKGIEIKGIAEREGYSDQYFHQVINRERRDLKVEDVLAACLGIPADRIWARRSPAA